MWYNSSIERNIYSGWVTKVRKSEGPKWKRARDDEIDVLL